MTSITELPTEILLMITSFIPVQFSGKKLLSRGHSYTADVLDRSFERRQTLYNFSCTCKALSGPDFSFQQSPLVVHGADPPRSVEQFLKILQHLGTGGALRRARQLFVNVGDVPSGHCFGIHNQDPLYEVLRAGVRHANVSLQKLCVHAGQPDTCFYGGDYHHFELGQLIAALIVVLIYHLPRLQEVTILAPRSVLEAIPLLHPMQEPCISQYAQELGIKRLNIGNPVSPPSSLPLGLIDSMVFMQPGSELYIRGYSPIVSLGRTAPQITSFIFNDCVLMNAILDEIRGTCSVLTKFIHRQWNKETGPTPGRILRSLQPHSDTLHTLVIGPNRVVHAERKTKDPIISLANFKALETLWLTNDMLRQGRSMGTRAFSALPPSVSKLHIADAFHGQETHKHLLGLIQRLETHSIPLPQEVAFDGWSVALNSETRLFELIESGNKVEQHPDLM
ncbi:hypothetical protein C8034_v005517 [Colletotrichum sidae]|uniref:F-box domain-containing protein n=1 Tax=Colletotrichum sidae TaxID=1347389 RepID=A0A4R8T6K4_9PEZI|nr:hypothetical protein C8034_v005517 [Colletotrichum sidae]